MATEAKPFASLSSGLLARKGAARPAMRPQGFGQVGNGLEDLGWNDMGFEAPKPAEVARDSTHDAFGDDVVEHPRVHPTGLTPVDSPVHHQQAEIVERLNGAEEHEVDEEFDETAEVYEPEAEEAPVAKKVPAIVVPVAVAAPAPRRAPRPRSAPGSKGKAAFTLRLDPDRHLKLRLACAVDGRSAQQLVTDALDQLLERMPEVDGLAAKAKRRG
ncbi:MAG: hypothetical protein ACJ8FB_05235 [Sphingomicrobium sp.]